MKVATHNEKMLLQSECKRPENISPSISCVVILCKECAPLPHFRCSPSKHTLTVDSQRLAYRHNCWPSWWSLLAHTAAPAPLSEISLVKHSSYYFLLQRESEVDYLWQVCKDCQTVWREGRVANARGQKRLTGIVGANITYRTFFHSSTVALVTAIIFY